MREETTIVGSQCGQCRTYLKDFQGEHASMRLSKMPARHAFWRVGQPARQSCSTRSGGNDISTTSSFENRLYFRFPEAAAKVNSTFWTASEQVCRKTATPQTKLRRAPNLSPNVDSRLPLWRMMNAALLALLQPLQSDLNLFGLCSRKVLFCHRGILGDRFLRELHLFKGCRNSQPRVEIRFQFRMCTKRFL